MQNNVHSKGQADVHTKERQAKNAAGPQKKSGPAGRVARLALLTSLAILMGYIESLIPLNFGIPGIKIGLCNIVILIVLLRYSGKEALLVSVARILVIGLLFGSLFSILYSLAGAVLSIAAMRLLLRSGRFGLLGISVAGGCLHNIGQLLVAKIVLPGLPLLWYTPVLMLAGMATGALVAVIVYEVQERI